VEHMVCLFPEINCNHLVLQFAFNDLFFKLFYWFVTLDLFFYSKIYKMQIIVTDF